MPKLTAFQLKAFIAANSAPYSKASKVFASIEGNNYTETLASAGIIGDDVRAFAVMYVAEKSGAMPYKGKRGGLTFVKDTTEYNRVKYIVSVAQGTRDTYVRNSKANAPANAPAKAYRMNKEQRGAIKAFIKLFGNAEAAVKAIRAFA